MHIDKAARPVAWGMAIGIFAGILGLFVLGGCSGSAADKAHDTLSAITEVADPLYGGTVRTCKSLQMEVVRREGTSYEEDQADIAKIRGICDGIYAAFEAAITAQVEARVAIDAFEAGDSTIEDVDAAINVAVEAWGIVRRLLVDLEAL